MRLRTTVDKARHQEIRGRVRPPDRVVEIEVRVPSWIPNRGLSEDEIRRELGWPASPSQ
jgi:hypothetical protein